MKLRKHQRGVNIFELAIVLAAFASAGFVAKHLDTDNPVIFAIAVVSAFLVYFLPTIFSVMKARRRRREEKTEVVAPSTSHADSLAKSDAHDSKE